MNSEEYNKKYKHIRVVYISDDGFWIDGREVLRSIGAQNYPDFYFKAVEKPSATFHEKVEALGSVHVKSRKYARHKFRSGSPIPDELVEWMIRQGRHKPTTP